MNGDGGEDARPEPPRLWLLAGGALVRFDGRDIEGILRIVHAQPEAEPRYSVEVLGDALAIELWAQPGGPVWPERSRQEAYAWFIEEFKVSVPFEVFDAALQRDFPRARAQMLLNEKMDAALGYHYEHVHQMHRPPDAPPPNG